ncbi:MAG: AAA family ATPase, partial [Acidobacteriota bacterium]
EISQKFSRSQSTLVLSGEHLSLPAAIAHEAIHYDLRLPGEDELREVLRGVIQSLRANNQVKIE